MNENEVKVVENENEVVEMNNNVEPLTKGEIAGAVGVGTLALIGAVTVGKKVVKYGKKAIGKIGEKIKKIRKKDEAVIEDVAVVEETNEG